MSCESAVLSPLSEISPPSSASCGGDTNISGGGTTSTVVTSTATGKMRMMDKQVADHLLCDVDESEHGGSSTKKMKLNDDGDVDNHDDIQTTRAASSACVSASAQPPRTPTTSRTNQSSLPATPSTNHHQHQQHQHQQNHHQQQQQRQLIGQLWPGLDVSKLPSNLNEYELYNMLVELVTSDGGGGGGESVNNTSGVGLVSDNQSASSSSAAAAVASAISGTHSGLVSSLMFLRQREKLEHINTLEQCVELIDAARNVIVLTGAGCSVSCGIPDFRSRDGVYARLRVDFPDLPDPQAMFDIFYFEHDPRPFFKFAKEIYPGQFRPSLSHLFVKQIEAHGKLLRNYTQNIDTLELAAQINNVIQCHGSFATATCTVCKFKVDASFIKEQIFRQEIPYCPKCESLANAAAATATADTTESTTTPETRAQDEENDDEDEDEDEAESEETREIRKRKEKNIGILKPDIVFFGEGLPDHYHTSIDEDKSKCDLLIVIGSSLKVKPVANIPHMLPAHVPQILINRESLKHLNFDVELLGDCDVIVNELLHRLDDKRRQEHRAAAHPDG